MATVTMTIEEYLALINGLTSNQAMPADSGMMSQAPEPKRARKPTAYQRRYKRNFRQIQDRYKKQNGEWKKNGFRSAVREAHRLSKK